MGSRQGTSTEQYCTKLSFIQYGIPIVVTQYKYIGQKIVHINPLNPELSPICYLMALLDLHFLHVGRIRVKSLTLRLLMSYIYIWSTYS